MRTFRRRLRQPPEHDLHNGLVRQHHLFVQKQSRPGGRGSAASGAPHHMVQYTITRARCAISPFRRLPPACFPLDIGNGQSETAALKPIPISHGSTGKKRFNSKLIHKKFRALSCISVAEISRDTIRATDDPQPASPAGHPGATRRCHHRFAADGNQWQACRHFYTQNDDIL